ncbi:hypothetical protein ACXWR7_12610, partial [Streptococcus pyogenes]
NQPSPSPGVRPPAFFFLSPFLSPLLFSSFLPPPLPFPLFPLFLFPPPFFPFLLLPLFFFFPPLFPPPLFPFVPLPSSLSS